MDMKPGRIELNVEELILHGLDPSDQTGIREAIERELERLFNLSGVPPSVKSSGHTARLDSARVEVPAESRADAIGRRVAQSVYHQMSASATSKKHGLPIR
jgi:hypothetical protein